MKWQHWIDLYLHTHCTARGLMSRTIAAYDATLNQFRAHVRFRLADRAPDELTARDVLEYVEYLRRERNNGGSAINRQVTILKNLYRAMVAMGELEADRNPMAHFPRMKAVPRKVPVFLSEEEVGRLMAQPCKDTVLGLRDRAVVTVLYGTGIRATECASLKDADVDLEGQTIRVVGKGGHERVVPLHPEVAQVLQRYRGVRGRVLSTTAFFKSRRGGALSRYAIYERIRTHAQHARIGRRVSPHRLRHTFATHLVKKGAQLVAIRDLLGHRSISSTQIYLHATADDLRRAAQLHPVEHLVEKLADLLPNVRLPFQWRPGEKVVRRP